MNIELAKGEQALVCLWQIERSTPVRHSFNEGGSNIE